MAFEKVVNGDFSFVAHFLWEVRKDCSEDENFAHGKLLVTIFDGEDVWVLGIKEFEFFRVNWLVSEAPELSSTVRSVILEFFLEDFCGLFVVSCNDDSVACVSDAL